MIRVFFLPADTPITALLPEMVHENDINKAMARKTMDQLFARTAIRLITKNSYQHVANIDLPYVDMALDILTRSNKEPWYFNRLVALTPHGKLRKANAEGKQLRNIISGDMMRVDKQFYLIMHGRLQPI